MHSILARARANVDLNELPFRSEVPVSSDIKQVESRPQPETAKQAEVSSFGAGFGIKQAEVRSKHQFQLQLATDSQMQSAAPAKITKPKMPKDRTMSLKEENVVLNSELEGMGRQVKKMSWASPEIENMWLRREATSQLLMKMFETTKGLNTSVLDLDDDSTRAPSSAGGSVRRFSSRA